MTFRLESLANSLGIDPVSLLLFKRLSRETQLSFSNQLRKAFCRAHRDPNQIPYGLELSQKPLVHF